MILSPAPEVPQSQRLTEQVLYGLLPVRCQGSQHPNASLGQRLSQTYETLIPGLRGLFQPQGRVALLDDLRKFRPGAAKSWFHVEHAPVQPSAPVDRSLLHQAVDAGVHGLYREDFSQIGQRLDGFAIDAGADSGNPIKPEP